MYIYFNSVFSKDGDYSFDHILQLHKITVISTNYF